MLNKEITLNEYVEKAKQELDKFKQEWSEHHNEDPRNWPMCLGEVEWMEQELSHRFEESI
jgi:hypothetical protein